MSLDYFIKDGGELFAGQHILIDLYGSSGFDDPAKIEKVLRDIVKVCQATLLHIHLHKFSENGGISGVAVLAESHVSCHTWPEARFAAFDIFMCGNTQPELAADILEKYFKPERKEVTYLRRGNIT
ncbi:MAG TPA: adenosylmethionine decarboxylase [Gammaproteobacteria bacterium]|nr:adenosylmethionine decarboxylase [Gammaproteobacteria bacterium]